LNLGNSTNKADGGIRYDNSADALIFRASNAEKMRIDSSGNVGIGTTSPDTLLHLSDTAGGAVIRLERNDTSIVSTDLYGEIQFEGQDSSAGSAAGIRGKILGVAEGATGEMALAFQTASGYGSSTERMRIDSSGNLLVGTTDSSIETSSSTEGVNILPDKINVARSAGVTANFNRISTDGNIVQFRKDGSTVGSIGTLSGAIHIAHTTSGLFFGTNLVAPCNTSGTARDNLVDLGNSSRRFDDIYATNGTIQTSDRNEKQDIEALSDAEQRVAVACKGLLRKFRWKSSVAENGDDARIHFGIIAQDLQDAFTAEGLDAGRYAMFTSTTWTDEETGEERSRMGVRYSELLAFIIAAI
jgi:hypothetical protein